MNEQFFKQLVAELIEAQGQAMAILTQSICQQIDPGRLKTDLQKNLASAKSLPSTSPIALKIAQQAMAAAEAERMLQAKPLSEGPHPKREG